MTRAALMVPLRILYSLYLIIYLPRSL
jgi:hypothetical protein